MSKNITLYDRCSGRDHYNMIKDTLIEVFIEGTDKCVFRGKNKCVIAGSGLMAGKLFDVGYNEITPSYDSTLKLLEPTGGKFEIDGKEVTTEDKLYQRLIHEATKVYLFAVGEDGCGTDASSVYAVPYVSWIAPSALVPFQYRATTNDLTDDERKKYFGKAQSTDGTHYAYYFKAFDNAPEKKQVYANGNDVTANLYDTYNEKVKLSTPLNVAGSPSATIEEAETYVKLQLSITSGTNHPDCREWFSRNGASINSGNARINTISLLSAYPVVGTDSTKSGSQTKYTYYKDIRPVTKLNIPNESLIDVTKGLVINYYIYF